MSSFQNRNAALVPLTDVFQKQFQLCPSLQEGSLNTADTLSVKAKEMHNTSCFFVECFYCKCWTNNFHLLEVGALLWGQMWLEILLLLEQVIFLLCRELHRERQMTHIYAGFLRAIWMQMAYATWFFSIKAEQTMQRNQRKWQTEVICPQTK